MDVDTLFSALDGIAYATDRNGGLTAYGRPNWDAFALENGCPSLTDPTSLLGRNLFDFIQGDEVAATYRKAAGRLLSGADPAFFFPYRCDAPDTERQMRMAMTPLTEGGTMVGVLYQSIMLGESMRPPLDIFDFAAVLAELKAHTNLPLVEICSWCQRIRGDGAEAGWTDAETYYRQGGISKVAISHTICEDCHARHFVKG